MKVRIHPTIVGISLATGVMLTSISAFDLSTQPEIESSQLDFCQNQSRDDFGKTELFFGLSEPINLQTTDEEFQGFIDTVVTPLFPDGLTVLTANGQFKNSRGKIVVERSRLLIVLYPANGESNEQIEQIWQAYKQTFRQESVLRVDERSCVSF